MHPTGIVPCSVSFAPQSIRSDFLLASRGNASPLSVTSPSVTADARNGARNEDVNP